MIMRTRLPTYHSIVVIGVVASAKSGITFGNKIIKMTGMKPGTLYTILKTLVVAGILSKTEEKGDPKEKQRPLRTYYELTNKGKRFANTYQAQVIASNPPLVSFNQFK